MMKHRPQGPIANPSTGIVQRFLKAKLDAIVIEKKLAITEAVSAVERERDEMKSG